MLRSEENSRLSGKKINIGSEEDVLYWCGFFGCKQKDLIDTVFKVGSSAVSVDAYLAMNWLSQRRRAND